MNLGQITANLTLNIQQFVNSMSQALHSTSTFGTNFNNNLNGANNSLNNTQHHVQELGRGFREVDRIVSGILISQAFYRATNAIQDASGAMVSFMNDMAKAQISMEYFLGTPQRAQGFLMNMQDFAADTSFNTQQAVALSRRLMGAQFAPEQIRSVMSTLNDASAVTGATPEQIDRIVLALTQVKTNGKLAGQEIRQFAEAGLPIYKILQKELGLTADQMSQIGKLHIDGDIGVKAILKGLQQYKGAAERIANTVPGMWETIKDNILIISNTMFQAPYNAFGRFLRRIRDGLNILRDELVTHGIGGVFERLIPPQLQDATRTIVGAVYSMYASIKELTSAMGPVFSMVGAAFTQAFAAVAPVVATITRAIATLAIIALRTSPVVRFLAATIVTLLVAQAAAKALMLLWSITRIGAICSAVARAVVALAEAIQILWLAVKRNPIITMIILATGWLTHMALSANDAATNLGGLGNIFNKFSGINVDKILQPTKNDSFKDWTDPFNQELDLADENLQDVGKSLDDTGNALDDTGKKAEKAGKKINDLFVASFDEVFQIPEKAADAGAALGDLAGAGAGLDALGNLGDLGGIGKGFDFQVPDVSMPKMDLGDIDWFKPIWDNLTKWWDKWVNELNNFWEFTKFWAGLMWDAFVDWIVDTGKAIGDFFVDIGKWFSDGYNNLVDILTKWTVETTIEIATWITDTIDAFTGWTLDVAYTISKWISDTIQAIQDWGSDTNQAIDDFIMSTIAGFGNWVRDSVSAVGSWSSQTARAIGDWISNTGSGIGRWASDRGTDFRNWGNNALSSVTTWASNAGATIANWIANTTFGKWVSNALGAFQSFAGGVDGVWRGISSGIKSWINSIIDHMNSLIGTLNNFKIKIPKINIGPIQTDGGTISLIDIPKIPHLATGGIVLKDQLVRMGEGNKREAVIPLENPSYMAPFSNAVAQAVAQQLSQSGSGQDVSKSTTIINLTLGALIGDERSLRELERRLQIIRLNEATRGNI